MSKYGMPYQGSKSSICDKLLKQLPEAENFYDLFGGGGAVTHAAALSGKFKNVFYNEIQKPVAGLFRDAIVGKYSYENFKPEWVSREEFHAKKASDAYVAMFWSFGNNRGDYLFGKDIETYKRSMHQAVVFGEFNELSSQVLGISEWETENIKNRRLFLRQKIEHYRKTGIPVCLHPFLTEKQLERLEQLERLPHLEQLQQLEQLKQFERLERLPHLEQLKGCSVTISSEDYRNVPILPNSIVYCDIPYENTRGYGGDFDRTAFLDWAANAPFPVYISEYQIEGSRFLEVFSTEKRVLMRGPIEGKEKANEKIYWNWCF